jgi:HSP20 family protein
MDRVFERVFGEFPCLERPALAWTPRLDVTETRDSVMIKAELPGLEAKDVDVALSGDTLTIEG